MRIRLRTVSFIAAGLLLALAAGCGGDSNVDAPAPTETPAATDGPEPTQAPTPEPAFQSFHYSVQLELALGSGRSNLGLVRQVEGFYEAPDSHSYRGLLGDTSPQHEVVVIGEEAWLREGGSGWTPQARADVQAQGAVALSTLIPGFLNDGSFGGRFDDIEGVAGEENGVPTLQYEITQDDIGVLSSILSSAFIQDLDGIVELEATIWVHESTGALVRLRLTGSTSAESVLGEPLPAEVVPGSSFEISLSISVDQIDDESIRISSPI